MHAYMYNYMQEGLFSCKNSLVGKISIVMLQAVIYYIVTMILTKELVIATDNNCTEYQFKTPHSYVGESCEDIYN